MLRAFEVVLAGADEHRLGLAGGGDTQQREGRLAGTGEGGAHGDACAAVEPDAGLLERGGGGLALGGVDVSYNFV